MTPINWEDSSWKQLSLVGDEETISLSHAKVYVFFTFCVMPWKDEPEPTIKYCLGRQVDVVSSQDRTLDTIDGEPIEFECNIFPGFTTLQL